MIMYVKFLVFNLLYMKYTVIFSFIFLFSLLSCQSQQTILSESDIVVDLDNLKETNIEYYSSYFDGGGIIALETTDKSLLGQIEKMCVSNDYFFILDNSGVLVFRKDGKYLRHISKCGSGPGEYNRLSDITIDDKNREIFLLDATKRCILVYDYENNYKRIIPLADKSFSSKFMYHDGALFFNTIGSHGLDKNWLLGRMELDENNETTYYLDADELNKGWYNLYYTDQQTFIPSAFGSPLFMQIFMDKIFRFEKGTPKPYISIYSESFPTKTFISDLNTGNISQELMESDYYYSMFDYVENEMFFSLKLNKGMTTKTLIHNKQTSVSYLVNMFFNDVLYTDEDASYIISSFDATDKNCVYTIEGESMFARQLLLENLEKGKINNEMNGYENLRALNDDEANPIIIYYNFKNNELF